MIVVGESQAHQLVESGADGALARLDARGYRLELGWDVVVRGHRLELVLDEDMIGLVLSEATVEWLAPRLNSHGYSCPVLALPGGRAVLLARPARDGHLAFPPAVTVLTAGQTVPLPAGGPEHWRAVRTGAAPTLPPAEEIAELIADLDRVVVPVRMPAAS